MNGNIIAMRVWDPDGAGPNPPLLAAIGPFTMAGTTAATRIANWDGTNWSTFPGNGLNFSGTSGAIATLSSNNNLFCAATGLTLADTVSTKAVAGWDGSSWFSLSTSSITALVSVAAVNADTIVVAGVFSSVNGVTAKNTAIWNTTTGWAALGDGVSSTGASCLGLSNGQIVVGHAGEATGAPSSMTMHRMGRWDGAWHQMGEGFTTTDSVAHPAGIARCLLEMPNGDVIAGGSFVFSGATVLNKIGRWDHTTDTWQPLGSGINQDTGSNHDVYALALLPSGDVVIGGDFTTAIGAPNNYLTVWHPSTSTYSALATGDLGVNGPVRALAVMPNGDLAVGGDFTQAGGQPAAKFAVFHFSTACAGDFNCSGGVSVQDIFDFLAAYFNNSASADVNHSGAVSVQDIFDFLAAYFTPCT